LHTTNNIRGMLTSHVVGFESRPRTGKQYGELCNSNRNKPVV